MAGDYYYYIFNVKDVVFDFMSHEIEDVLGYPPDVVDVPFFLSVKSIQKISPGF